MRETMRTPGTKPIVSGERRMGKTSALGVALDGHRAAGGIPSSSCRGEAEKSSVEDSRGGSVIVDGGR